MHVFCRMPRFLELDYLDEYICKKNSLLNRYMLTVPYLDYGREKPFTGEVKHMMTFVERDSGLKDGCKSIGDSKSLEDDFSILKQLSNVELRNLEKFDVETRKHNPSMLEIIPSSNPDSPMPDSFDELMLNEFEKEVEEYVVQSIDDCLEDDQAPLEIKDGDDPFLLEEIEPDVETDNLRNPFSADALSKKLKPTRLPDPFAEKFEPQAAILKSDRKLSVSPDQESQVNESKIKNDVDCKEDLKFNNLHKNDGENLLEETLVEVTDNKSETEKELPFKSLNELEKFEIHSGDKAEFSDLDSKLPDSSVEQLDVLEELKEVNEKDKEFNLLIDIKEEIENIEFESPISSKTNFIEDEQITTYKGIFEAVECKEISPLVERHFVSPLTKLKYEESSRDYDKYLDDTLAMSLKVPHLEHAELNTPLSSILEAVDLKKQDTNCELEVNLAWNPLQSNINRIEYSQKELSKEMQFCEKDNLSVEDPINDDVKKISLDINHETELAKEDFEISPHSNSKETLKGHGQSVNSVKFQEKDAKKKFLSNLAKLEKNVVKREEQPKKKPDSSTSNAIPISPAIKADLQVSTPFNSKRPMNVTPLKKTGQVIESPLDHFVLLRTGEKTAMKAVNSKPPIAMVPPRNHVKAAKVKPSVFITDQKSEAQAQSIVQDIIKKAPQKEEQQEKTQRPCQKREIISLQLTDDYLKILRKLEKDSRPLLAFLKGKEVLSSEYSFFSLHPDVTRFLLRQQERKYESCKENCEDEDIMKGIICLHALILAVDAISNYGITAAIGVLKSIREKYEHIINGVLDPVRKQLAKEHYKLQNASKMHPKIEKISTMMQQILQKPDRKVIILVRRYFECCCTMLEGSLRCVKNVVLKRYPKEAAEEGFVSNMISQANVIVAELSTELEFCPWKRFSFVFEFEFKEESQWYNVCFEGNRNLQGFFAFACLLPKDIEKQDDQTCTQANPSSITDRSLQCFSQHIIIGSTKITGNNQLLCHLESQFNVTVIERDYSLVYKNQETLKYHFQPDIVIDERTCIILFIDDDAKTCFRDFEDQMASVLLKCTKCYVIACCYSSSRNKIFPHDVAEKLSTAILRNSNLKKMDEKTSFQVLYAFSIEQTADHIVNICNNARDTSQVWTREDWGKRFWLTEEISMHEQFLLSFPYFTSFSAQVALTATSLKTLLAFTLPEMKMALKWIPEKLLEAFHSSINQDIRFCPVPMTTSEFDRSDTSKRTTNECMFVGGQHDKVCPTPSYLQMYSPRNNNGDHDVAKTRISEKDASVSQSIGNKQRIRSFKPIPALNDEQSQFHFNEEADDYYPCYTEDSYPGGNSCFEKPFTKDTLSSKSNRNSEQFTPQISSSERQHSAHFYQQNASYSSDFNKMVFDGDIDYDTECFAGLLDKSSRLQGKDNRQNFPTWKLTTNENTNGMTNQPRSWRKSKDKIVFNSIPKSMFQDGDAETSPTSLTPSNRSNVQYTPSTVRLKPSKRRRLTYERDPGSKTGQTRLAFI